MNSIESFLIIIAVFFILSGCCGIVYCINCSKKNENQQCETATLLHN